MATLESGLLKKHTWLITGAAGFIGSHLVETLLKHNQHVIGIDNFATGHQSNLDHVLTQVSLQQAKEFQFFEMDIRSNDDCRKTIKNIDFVLHHAALASVPESTKNPELFNSVNLYGFINVLSAAKDAGVKRFIYASSSSVYGNVTNFPIIEDRLSTQLSPYAVTKYANELYASTYASCYAIQTIGLRYFNVFGPRQDPNGSYAAVIPRWINSLLRNDPVYIYGDGKTTRDFCYVADIVKANLLAALSERSEALNTVYNIASGGEITLTQLYHLLCEITGSRNLPPLYNDFRSGDIRRSLASIDKAKTLLDFNPEYTLSSGLVETIKWYRYLFLLRNGARILT